MRRLPLTCSLLAALSFAAPAGAQTQVTVTGTITDAVSGAPVAGASVMFGRSRRTVWTDDQGRFALARVDPGNEWLTIQQLGYEHGWRAVAVATGMQPLAVTLQPDPVMLEQLDVIARRLQTRPEAAFMSMHAFDTRDLGTATGWSVLQFLRTRGAVTLVRCQRPHTRYCIWSRGLDVPAQVYLDGMRLYGGMDELEFVPITDLYRIEVYQRGVFIQVLTNWWAARAARDKGWESQLPLFIPEPTVGSYW